MAEITVEESWREIGTLTDRAEQAMADGRPDEAVDRWQAVLAHPCAHHQVAACEILDDIHRAFREAGHYEDAIAAKREAIAAGYRSVPDPEADIAECLLDAGESEVALATDDPDQVVMQLLELAEDAWGEVPPVEDRPCAHSGYRPDTSRAELDERARRNRRRLLELVPAAADAADAS